MTSDHPKTILHVIDKFSMEGSHPSSCTKLLADWAAYHDKSRFDLKFCGLQRDPGGTFLEERGHEVHYIERGKISPAIAGDIAGLAHRLGADLLHLHGYSAANFGRLAGRRTRIPAIVHEHAVLKVKPHQFLADLLLRGHTDCAVAISNAVREFMVRGRCVPRRLIRVIHNGIRLDEFATVDDARSRALRGRLGIDPEATVIGTVTRLREEKGNTYFIDACIRLAARLPRAVFLVIGDGPDRQPLIEQARAGGLGDDRLIMAGFVEDVPAALSILDVAVVASIREGLSLAVLEAMAATKPIVATRVGGILELVAHDDSALLVPSADGEALAGAILRLVEDPERAQTLALRAVSRSRQFSIESNVRELETLYGRLIEGRDPRSSGRCRQAA